MNWRIWTLLTGSSIFLQELALHNELSIKETFTYYGYIFNLSDDVIEKRGQELKELLKLPSYSLSLNEIRYIRRFIYRTIHMIIETNFVSRALNVARLINYPERPVTKWRPTEESVPGSGHAPRSETVDFRRTHRWIGSAHQPKVRAY